MITSLRKWIWISGGFLLLFIAGLQFFRVEKLYRLITPAEAGTQPVAVMAAAAPPKQGEELVVYITEGMNDSEKKLQGNLQYALDYAKVKHESIASRDIPSLSPNPYHILVLTGESAKQYPLAELQAYVRQGGRLVVGMRLDGTGWEPLAGVRENRGFYPEEVFGMKVNQALFPGYPDVDKEAGLLSNSMLDVTLEPEAKVYLSAESHPMLWTYDYGKGRVVYWNASSLGSKLLRGLLLHSVGLASPSFVTGQAAVKSVHIDDFPAPVPGGNADIITGQYGMSVADFYKKVWWADMKTYAERYNLIYTGYMIGTYRSDDSLDAGALISQDEEAYLYYGRELLAMGGELGLHGYNHQPLVKEGEAVNPELGYEPWNSGALMEAGLARMKTAFTHFYPNAVYRSYVPPSNILSRTGLQALHRALPEINNIAAVYNGSADKGDFVQEFGFDADIPGLYHMPRISSGYRFNQETQFYQADAVATMGVFQHFIHPDDLLDPKRIVGSGWEDMKAGFEGMFRHTNEVFPYLEPLRASSMREKLIAYQKAELNVRYTEDRISLTGRNLVSPSVFTVRVEAGKKLATASVSGVEVSPMKEAKGLYLVKLSKPQAELTIIKDE
ncbi:DUF2194 domain-containing protein [Paenibacillus aurantius]|uniref:DUF2194 domain-containing protein n=1 Tax=Paenibacillus aurantius TaxID=2918900 RepID=A0AA96RCV8_9BACL|nr:DUF2194 domain-containing protein [Paenibacillus aurantius]WNQ10945.1 DUF2194 domain-containing protein [Paenibacillus aurantius]